MLEDGIMFSTNLLRIPPRRFDMTRILLLVLLLIPAVAAAQTPTYWQDVRPILRKHCTVCHSAKNLREPDVSGGLALDAPDAIRKGVEGRPVVKAGHAGESLLIKALLRTKPKTRMPLDAPPLEKETIDVLRTWIDKGAVEGTRPTTDEPALAKTAAVVRKRDVLFPVSTLPPVELAGKGQKMAWTLKVGPLAPIAAVTFSPDGKYLAAGSYGQVAIWDVREGKLSRLLTNVLGAVNDLKFSPDGSILAVAGGQPSAKGDLRLYHTGDWKLLGVLRGHDDVVFSVAFRNDGKQLASASFDHTVKLWDVARQQALQTYLKHSDFVYAVAFDPSGNYLYSASKDRTVQMVDVVTGKSKFTFSAGEQDALAVAISPDGKTLLSAGFDPGVQVWSPATGEKSKAVGGHNGGTHEIVFSATGDRYASGGADKTAKVWDAAGSNVYAVAFSPDAKRLATGSADGITRLWDTATANLLLSLVGLPGEKDAPQWAAIAPQGYLDGDDRFLKLGRFRTAAGKEIADAALHPVLVQPALIARAFHGESLPDVKFAK